VIRKGNKKDTVSVTPSSLHDLKEYSSIRNARYAGKDDENEFVFIKLYKGEPLPLTKRDVGVIYRNELHASATLKAFIEHLIEN
jgi:hypothetical protein